MAQRIDYFSDESLSHDLRGKTVRGGALTAAAQVIQVLVMLVSVPILGNLLEPEDFGLVAMVTVLTGLANMFVDAGLSMATVQRKEITHQQVTNLFWVAAAMGLLVAAIVACLAPGIAWIYGEPRLVGITLMLAPTFVISGLTLQHQAMLRRAMQFRWLAMIQVASVLVAQAAAIAWAWQFRSYWALVVAPLTLAAGRLVGAWTACRWRPGLPRRNSGVRPMVFFGANLTGFMFVNYFARNADNAMIGYVWGSGELGLYNLAYRLLMMPLERINAPLTAVAIPALSRLLDDPPRYRSFFRRAILLIASLGMPLVCLVFCTIGDIIPLVLDAEWAGTVPIFYALGPAALLGSLNATTGWIFISTGNTDRQFRLSLITVPFILVCMAIGLPWGGVGVATGLSVAWMIVRIPITIYCYHGTPVTLGDLWQAVSRPAIAALLALAVTIGRSILIGTVGNGIVEIVTDVAVFSVAYSVFWLIQPHGMEELRRTLDLAKDLRGGRAGSELRPAESSSSELQTRGT